MVLAIPDTDMLIVEELKKQTDRGAALIAGAYLDERLADALRARLHRHEQVEVALFREGGPLGSFATRIDLGLLLGIYTDAERKWLHSVRRIRNKFAHQPRPLDFDTPPIKDWCRNIDIGVRGNLQQQKPDGTMEDTPFDLRGDGTPRTAFFNTFQALLMIFATEIHTDTPRKPPPPAYPFSDGATARAQ